jgi:hypothetical protein
MTRLRNKEITMIYFATVVHVIMREVHTRFHCTRLVFPFILKNQGSERNINDIILGCRERTNIYICENNMVRMSYRD